MLVKNFLLRDGKNRECIFSRSEIGPRRGIQGNEDGRRFFTFSRDAGNRGPENAEQPRPTTLRNYLPTRSLTYTLGRRLYLIEIKCKELRIDAPCVKYFDLGVCTSGEKVDERRRMGKTGARGSGEGWARDGDGKGGRGGGG